MANKLYKMILILFFISLAILHHSLQKRHQLKAKTDVLAGCYFPRLYCPCAVFLCHSTDNEKTNKSNRCLLYNTQDKRLFDRRRTKKGAGVSLFLGLCFSNKDEACCEQEARRRLTFHKFLYSFQEKIKARAVSVKTALSWEKMNNLVLGNLS